MVVYRTGGDAFRPAHNERYPNAAFMALPFQAAQFPIPTEELRVCSSFFVRTVVTAEDDDGVLVQPFFFQFLQDFAHVIVQTGNHTGKLGMGMLRNIITSFLVPAPGFISKELLLVAFQNRIIRLRKFRMRQGVGEKAIERLLSVLLVQPFQRLTVNQVSRILCTFLVIIAKHRIVDIIFHQDAYNSCVSFLFTVSVQKIGIIRMSLELAYITIEFINTPFIRRGTRTFITTCPLAEDSRSITVLLHDFRENDMIFIVWFLTGNGEFVINSIFYGGYSLPVFLISTHMGVSRVLPRHQRSTGRGAHRTTGIGLSKQHAFGCHTVYVRRFNVFLSVTS